MEQMSKEKTWDLVVLILSIYVLIELTLDVVWSFSAGMHTILVWIDTAICGVFLYDIYLRARAAENKREFWRSWQTWIDLVSSIPFAGIFHMARIARVIKLIRLLRILRGMKAITPVLRWIASRGGRKLLVIYIISLLVVMFYSSLALYTYESPVNDMINTIDDAFWWAFISVTSVGYGDIYPITGVGRCIAVILITAGMGLFSIVTADIASTLMLHARNDH